jgi:cellulose synthase/poly-beta-1,6-N-acetylglucosamine synthase-like glycosyltransferase
VIGTAAWLLLWTINGTVLAYFILINTGYLVTAFMSVGALRRYAERAKALEADSLVESEAAPPVTVIAPAYNEEATCVESVRSLLTLRYADHRIIVVNDGSRDGTLTRLLQAFEMEPTPRLSTADISTQPVREVYRSRWHPNLWLVDKENGGKADALNAGLRYCETPLFCAIDMDSLVERDALVRVVWPFLEDRHTVAAGGVIRIANGCRVEDGIVRRVVLPRNLLARFQVLEYFRAFLSARMGWEALDSLLIISGAFGIFKRSVVVEAGGFWKDTVGEDMELVVRLHRHCIERGIPYRIRAVPDAVAWTEAPESLRVLGRQRDRWQRGLTESLQRHRVMLLHPRYGRVGVMAYPYFYFLEMLGPLIELVGYGAFIATLLLGWASPHYATAFLMVAVVFGLVLSLVAVGLGELTQRRYPRFQDLLHLIWLALLENLGYRQLNTYWRARGMFSHFIGRKEWGEMVRKGFQAGGGAPGA